MARRDVIEVTCDRCSRKETQSSAEAPNGPGPEVEVTFHGDKIIFNDLCKRCREAVRGYFTRISKKSEDVAPAKEPSSVEQVQADEKPEEPKKKGFLGSLTGSKS